MNKFIQKLALLFIATAINLISLAQTAVQPAGNGTSANPYLIATLDNLYWVSQNGSSWGSGFFANCQY